jgi:hypothetical protein
MTVKSKESSAPPDLTVAKYREALSLYKDRDKRADDRSVQLSILECLVDILEALKK